MILSAHQPAYIPWLGYFHKIMASDIFVVLDDVQFEKNSFINRNKIKVSNNSTWLTVPVKMKGHIEKKINEIEIENSQKWMKKHYNSIKMNYGSSPFFKQHQEFIETFYQEEKNYLIEILKLQLAYFITTLEIETKIIYQSDLSIFSKKQELISDLCTVTNSNVFLFGAQGRDYADKDFFEDKGISIFFQDYIHPEYNQKSSPFIPNMSIWDLLFNYDVEDAKRIIMEKNISKKDLRVK